MQKLDHEQLSKLYRAMKTVLEVAIERGAGSEELLDRLPSGYLLRSREEGANCPRCGAAVRTLKAAGRTAYYCPACQPEPERLR